MDSVVLASVVIIFLVVVFITVMVMRRHRRRPKSASPSAVVGTGDTREESPIIRREAGRPTMLTQLMSPAPYSCDGKLRASLGDYPVDNQK